MSSRMAQDESIKRLVAMLTRQQIKFVETPEKTNQDVRRNIFSTCTFSSSYSSSPSSILASKEAEIYIPFIGTLNINHVFVLSHMSRLSCHYRSTPRYHGVVLNVCPVLNHWWCSRHVSYDDQCQSHCKKWTWLRPTSLLLLSKWMWSRPNSRFTTTLIIIIIINTDTLWEVQKTSHHLT
jgi:hypothetical protein